MIGEGIETYAQVRFCYIINDYCRIPEAEQGIMLMKLVSALFVNLSILGMLLFTFTLLSRNRKGFISPAQHRYRRVQFGVSMGFLGIILMYYTIPLDGTIVDLRQIPVIVAAGYGGVFAPIVASLIIAAGRLILFDTNASTLLACSLIIIIGLSCAAWSKLRLDLRYKWCIMIVSNLILTSITFYLIINDKQALLHLYAGYWSIFFLGGVFILYLMEYLRKSKELFQTAEENAATDFLTGLNNLRKFDELMRESIDHADKVEEPLSFILIDVDHFKQINDTYGHQSGDEVLKQLGVVIGDSCRPMDIVSRNGGEEFSVILPSCAKQEASQVAENIRSSVERHKFTLPTGRIIKVTVSLGVSTYRDTTIDQQTLIKQADNCLYHAKDAGRNRVVQAR